MQEQWKLVHNPRGKGARIVGNRNRTVCFIPSIPRNGSADVVRILDAQQVIAAGEAQRVEMASRIEVFEQYIHRVKDNAAELDALRVKYAAVLAVNKHLLQRVGKFEDDLEAEAVATGNFDPPTF
jgi:hypothetical protein